MEPYTLSLDEVLNRFMLHHKHKSYKVLVAINNPLEQWERQKEKKTVNFTTHEFT